MILRGDYVSDILHSATNIQVLIPEWGKPPFRVVYLLHGLHGDQGTWFDNTMLPVYAKNYNAVFVTPEVGRSFYTNLKYGRKYYDFISEELPEMCKKIFNVSAKREDTAVMGCSMGGYGSLKLALSKPETYGFCGAISSACLYFRPLLEALRVNPEPWLKTGAEAAEILTDLYSIYGESLEYRTDYDILELVKNFSAASSKPKIFSACGTEDDLHKDNIIFKDEMKNTSFEFEYQEWAGDHDWVFFNEALKKALEFWHK